MTEFDLIIRGGRIVNAGDSFTGDVGVQAGKIAAVGHDIGEGKRTIDARNHWVLPGGIEAHCHIEQESSGGVMTADDYLSGSVSAAFGGNTCIIPFAAQHRGQSISDVLTTYHARAGPKSVIDYSFHLIVSDPTEEVLKNELPAAIRQGLTSLKIYMTYDRLILNDEQMLDVFSLAKEHDALTMIHAENNALIKWMTRRLVDSGQTAPKYHALSHPKAAEIEAINRAIALAGFVNAPILIVHVSTEEGAGRIADAQAAGRKVFAETCPQYLLLDGEAMDLPGLEGAKFCCSPPLRDQAAQEALWSAIRQGTIQVVSSDHAPYCFDSSGKLSAGPTPAFPQIASGLPGIELRLPLLFSEGVNKDRISPGRFVELTSLNAARIYGLDHRKGSIAVGMDGDITIWDPTLSKTVTQEDLHDNMDYTPYAGMTITGWPVTVIRRGEIVVADNELKAEPGSGNFIKRNASGAKDVASHSAA